MSSLNFADVEGDLDFMFEDLPATITYKSRTEGASEPVIDFDTGGATETFTDLSLTVVPGRFTEKDVAKSDGFLAIGDVYFYVKKKDFTVSQVTYVPKKTDLVVDGTETFSVIDVQLDTSEMLYKLLCRKYK